MKAVIVCASDGNTRQVAEAMAPVLRAPVVAPGADLSGYDLVGFGSGIYYRSFHASLREFVAALPPSQGRAFVYATSGFPDAGLHRFSCPLVRLLSSKGFEVVDTFSCRGHDLWFPFRLVGGLRKGRPNTTDLEAARRFAVSVGARG